MLTISVIILTKDRRELLERALQSIALQTYKDFEVVLVNDGSTDGTETVVEKFMPRFHMNVIRHKQSQGIIKSRNEAVIAATGEYVAFLDDDDEWTDPDKLKKQVGYFQSHPDAVVVGGGIRVELGSRNYELWMRPEADNQIRKGMLFKNPFFTSTVMVRRKAVVDAGLFEDDGKNYAEDYGLWLKLGKIGKLYNFQEVFTNYRLPEYTAKVRLNFLKKQAELVSHYGKEYPYYILARLAWKVRLSLFSILKK